MRRRVWFLFVDCFCVDGLFAFGYGLRVCGGCDGVEVFVVVVVFFGLGWSSVYICICFVSSASISLILDNADIPSISLIRGVLVLLSICSTGATSVVDFTGGESFDVILLLFLEVHSHFARRC